MPKAQHLLCCHHLMMNALAHGKDKGDTINDDTSFHKAFWKLQSSPTQAAYDSQLAEFLKIYPETAKYLDNVSDGCWRLFEFNDLKIKTFGHKTSNLAEINNARDVEKRKSHPFSMFLGFVRVAATDIVLAQKRADEMVSRNQDITEGAAKSMSAMQQNDLAKNLYATAISTSFPFTYLVDFVNHHHQTKWAQRVTLYENGGGSCTCGMV